MEILIATVSVLFLTVVGLVVAVWALARQVGILFERVAPLGALVTDAGPAVGAPAPGFVLPSIAAPGEVAIGAAAAHSTLLFFLSPSCPVCKKLLPILGSIRSSERAWLRIVLASDGDPGKQREFIAQRGLHDYPYLLSSELGMALRVSRLPFAVLIGEDGTILAKGLVNNREQIESLFNAKELGAPSIQSYLDRGELQQADLAP